MMKRQYANKLRKFTRTPLMAFAVIIAFAGLSFWLFGTSKAAISGRTTFYLHAARSDYNQTYNTMTPSPANSSADTTTATAGTTAYTAGSFCNSNGNTTDAYNVITVSSAAVGNYCVASFVSQPMGQSITLNAADGASMFASNLWTSVQNSKISAQICMSLYQLSGSTLTSVSTSACSAATSTTTLSGFGLSFTPSGTITLAATDRLVAIVYVSIVTAHSSGSGNTVTFAFDSSARTAPVVSMDYITTTPNKPALTGSMDDDFTTAAATTACSSAGVSFNTKWTCLQNVTGGATGSFNDADATPSGGDSSGWLWLKNTSGNSGASDFGASPTNTFLYQSLPTGGYGNGTVRTVVESTNAYVVNNINGTASPYDHSGLALWASNTDFLEVQVYSTTNTTGTNSVYVALNNSGTLSGATSLNPTTTSGLYNRVWLGFQNTGGSYQAQYSTDGTTWNNLGSPVSHAPFATTGLDVISMISNTSSQMNYSGAFDWFQYTFATPTYNQISYRWFANADSTTPGSPFTLQNTPYVLTSTGEQFRLRTLLQETGQTATSGDNFRLQYAQQKGTCTASTYGDVPPDTGPIGGSSAANDTTVGTLAWTNPSYALASDGLSASVNSATSVTSYYLDVTGFGFALPANATVSGIVVNTTASSSGVGSAADGSVKIIQGGVLAGTDHTQGAVGSATYGNSTDLWGLSWTPAQINASNFGVGISINISGNAAFSLNYVSITVYFSVPNSLAFYNNPTPASGANITTTANDPTDGTQTLAAETYQETNSFTNAQAAVGNTVDGEWDFSLYDNGSLSGTTYCFRMVKSDGSALGAYTNYPTITTMPTIDQFMRGGMWFSRDDNKQSYYWAQ